MRRWVNEARPVHRAEDVGRTFISSFMFPAAAGLKQRLTFPVIVFLEQLKTMSQPRCVLDASARPT